MRFRGTVFRAHNPRWAFSPLSGNGAARYGGRFNPTGLPALYTSLRMETAWLEAQQGFAFKVQPLTICAYEIDCEDIADLTNPETLAGLGSTLSALSCAWEDIASRGKIPPSWALAKQLIAQDISAVIVPSFAPGAIERDRNLVFYKWSDTLPHQVRVIDDEMRLPKNPGSWL